MVAVSNPLREDIDHILTHTAGVWESLRGESIFVTGATGFFGRWLLESFAHANRSLGLGARLIALSRNPGAFASKAPHLGHDPAIRWVRGDVRRLSLAEVESQLGRCASCSFVIHAATEASAKLNAEDPLLMIDTIVEGTRAALDFAVAVGAKRFLLTSSGAVYGRQPADLTHIPEEYVGGPDCTDPGSAYGEAKRLAELLCACYGRKHQMAPLIARCFAFVGPFLPLDAHFAIGNFIRDGLQGRAIQIKGDGSPYRSYLYAADLAIWLWTILIRGEPMRPYNVGSPEDLPLRDLASIVAGTFPEPPSVSIALAPVPEKPAERYVPAVSRAISELGLSVRVPLAAAIARTTAFSAALPL
jgi:dTDP-glucose 4,6-dehydratase